MKLTYERLTKAPDLCSVSARFVKCAIRANPRAKGKVDVKMANHVGCMRFVLSHWRDVGFVHCSFNLTILNLAD